MKIFDQEHYDLMIQFEREHSGRFDKEAKEFWPKGIVYQDGHINELFLAYRRGYAFCEADMRSDIQNLEASRDGYRADAERDARDAERYRWLRVRWGRIADTYDGDSNRLVEIREADDRFEGWDVSPESLDAAIDAAIDAQQGKGGE